MDVQQYRRPRGTSLFLSITAATLLATGAAAQRHASPSGVLHALTYNIAGLPEGVSRSRPSLNVRQMGPLFADYDLVLVQEDFAFDHDLRSGITHPYCSSPSGTGDLSDLGDGLNRFARHPFREHERQRWLRCHGIVSDGCDCLARKGFSVATHELAPGVTVDVYNVHLDAGRTRADSEARAGEVRQLLSAMEERSAGEAVIVGGDTNLWSRDDDILADLLEGGALEDACRVLGCRHRGRVDRVLYRSGAHASLRAVRYGVARDLVDEQGRPLSDHLGVEVDLAWRAR